MWKMWRTRLQSQAGLSLVELLVTMGLLAIVTPALISGYVTMQQGRPQLEQKAEAKALMEKQYEAVRSIREQGWDGIAENGVFHASLSGSEWVLNPGSVTVDDKSVELEIEDAMRLNGQLVETGGDVDPSTKKITFRVSWTEPKTFAIEETAYLTRYLDNLSYEETTEVQFNAGDHNGVAVTAADNGEIILGAGGQGDWCRPSDFIQAELNLPQNGAARDVKAIEGKAFTGTSQSGTGSFVEIDISNGDPPSATIAQLISGYETNDVFIDENYAYIATNDYSRDVVIIDLDTHQEVGYFNDTSWFGTAQGIWVKDDIAYVTIGLNLHTVDLSSKHGARPELDRIFLWGTGYRLQVVGNYAYIAMDWGSSEMRLVNVSNPSNMSLAAKADVNGERGQEVFVNETGTRVYLATSVSSSRNELFIINADVSTSNKNRSSYNLPVISEYNSDGMNPRGVTSVPGNKVLLAGIGGEEYQVIDISNENNPVRCGGINVDAGIYGVAAVLEEDNDAYAYIVTGDHDAEFKIIEGGPGASYSSEGIFESAPFDPGFTTAFNRFSASAIIPTQTEAMLQLGVADPQGNSCNHDQYEFIGPDGTSNTFFGIEGNSVVAPVPIGTFGNYNNPGRCFKYKLFLFTNDSTMSPTFQDITINYSP